MTKQSIRPLKGKVLVHNIEGGEQRTKGGIILRDDNGKDHGIRQRWAQVYAVGPDITDVKPGEWCLIKHGRWSRGVPLNTGKEIITVRQVDWPDAILVVTDQPPNGISVV